MEDVDASAAQSSGTVDRGALNPGPCVGVAVGEGIGEVAKLESGPAVKAHAALPVARSAAATMSEMIAAARAVLLRIGGISFAASRTSICLIALFRSGSNAGFSVITHLPARMRTS